MAKRNVPPRSVADLMHGDVVTVSPDASLAELAGLLRRHAISGLPVTDEKGKAVGTVSVSDLLGMSDRMRPTPSALRETGRWESLERLTVRDIMAPDVFGVAPGSGLDELLEFFSRTGLHRAFVLEGGRVIGVVSVTDLLALLVGDGPEQPPPDAGSKKDR